MNNILLNSLMLANRKVINLCIIYLPFTAAIIFIFPFEHNTLVEPIFNDNNPLHYWFGILGAHTHFLKVDSLFDPFFMAGYPFTIANDVFGDFYKELALISSDSYTLLFNMFILFSLLLPLILAFFISKFHCKNKQVDSLVPYYLVFLVSFFSSAVGLLLGGSNLWFMVSCFIVIIFLLLLEYFENNNKTALFFALFFTAVTIKLSVLSVVFFVLLIFSLIFVYYIKLKKLIIVLFLVSSIVLFFGIENILQFMHVSNCVFISPFEYYDIYSVKALFMEFIFPLPIKFILLSIFIYFVVKENLINKNPILKILLFFIISILIFSYISSLFFSFSKNISAHFFSLPAYYLIIIYIIKFIKIKIFHVPYKFVILLSILIILGRITGLAEVSLLSANPPRQAIEFNDILRQYGKGRVLVEDLDHELSTKSQDYHPWFNGHTLTLFSLTKKREFIGSPVPHLYYKKHCDYKFTTFINGHLFGKNIKDFNITNLLDYFNLYNIDLIVLVSKESKMFFSSYPQKFKFLKSLNKMDIYSVKSTGFFIYGKGNINSDWSQIHLSDLKPYQNRIVIKYHWVNGIKTEPDVKVERVIIKDDPIGFIGLLNPPENVKLFFKPQISNCFGLEN